MADRTSAKIFGEVFDILAGMPKTEEIVEAAREIMDLACAYDFDEYQMGCDDALRALGLKVTP